MSATTRGSKRRRGSISNVHFTIGYSDLNFGKFIFGPKFYVSQLKHRRYRKIVKRAIKDEVFKAEFTVRILLSKF